MWKWKGLVFLWNKKRQAMKLNVFFRRYHTLSCWEKTCFAEGLNIVTFRWIFNSMIKRYVMMVNLLLMYISRNYTYFSISLCVNQFLLYVYSLINMSIWNLNTCMYRLDLVWNECMRARVRALVYGVNGVEWGHMSHGDVRSWILPY